MSGSAWALQNAIHDALAGDAALTTLITGVYDHVPGDAMLPFVTLGPAMVSDWSAGSFDGHDHDITLDVWVPGPGHGAAKIIMGAVQDALHDRDLALEGAELVMLRFRTADLFMDGDDQTLHGQTLHGIMRFRALTRTI